MKRVALYTVIVLATLSVVAVLALFPEVVVLFLLSLAVAAATRPLVELLMQRGLPRGVSVVISYLSIVAVIVLILLTVSGPFFSELQKLGDATVSLYDRMWVQWPEGTQLQRTLIHQLPPPEVFFASLTGQQGGAMAQTLLGITTSSFATISQIFAVLVLSIYWTIDRIHFERLWLSLLPVDIRARWRNIGRDVEHDLGSYIRSEVVQSILAGLLLGLGYSLMGMPFPTLLAVFAALAWLIPWLGAVMVILPITAIGFTAGWQLALGAAFYTMVVLILLEFFVEPRLSGRQQYSSWLAVLFIIGLGDALGLAGVIIAPPLAAIVQMTARRVLQDNSPMLQPIPEIESARQIARLDERLEAVHGLIDTLEEKPQPQTNSMLGRLDSLVQQANTIIADQPKNR